jgi:hypothetical protein
MSEPQFTGPLAQIMRPLWSEPHPDPWPADIDAEIKLKTAVPMCMNCLSPKDAYVRFCGNCGHPSGDYAALDPYQQLFLVGDVLRKGVIGPPDKHVGVHLFLIIFSISQYSIFAPVYWFWMVRRACGKPICANYRIEFNPDEREEA